MFADTDAIRALGAAQSAQAVDLDGVAAALLALPDGGPLLGPVGAAFLAALTDAAARTAQAVSALSRRVRAGHANAQASAVAYEDADRRAGHDIAGV